MKEFDRLIEIVDTLRSDKGCAWDKAQTLDNLRGYLLEETYELLDSLDDCDEEKVKEELGDLFLLLVFMIRIFKEKAVFEAPQVLESVNRKLVSRHPHVFAGKKMESSGEIVEHWVKAKAKAKQRRTISERLPKNAPALLLAALLNKECSYLGEKADVREVCSRIREKSRDLSRSENKEVLLPELVLECVSLAFLLNMDLEAELRREVFSRAKNKLYSDHDRNNTGEKKGVSDESR